MTTGIPQIGFQTDVMGNKKIERSGWAISQSLVKIAPRSCMQFT
jgi:hypothetical protein